MDFLAVKYWNFTTNKLKSPLIIMVATVLSRSPQCFPFLTGANYLSVTKNETKV